MDTPNPFRSLTEDWARTGRDFRAQEALRRWRAAEPSLAPFDTPADVVACCHQRGDARSANVVLGALVRLAHDELAARAALQAVLPSLAARAWRRRWDATAGRTGVWDDVEELAVDLVALAIERIAELAGTSPEWPSQAIVEVSYARLRWAAQVARRRRLTTVPLEAVDDVAVPDEDACIDDLGPLLVEAVRCGALRRRDAALIYATRVLGYTPAELAEAQRRDVRALRYQRARAERTLAAIAG